MAVPRALWSLVAAAQAAVWFFALPPLCKPHWERVWALSPGPLASQVALNQLALIYFISYTLVMIPIYRGNYAFFEQYKISDKPWAWRSEKQWERDAFWALSFKSVKLFCFNFGVLVPLLTAGKYLLLGDNMSFKVDKWPSYGTLLHDNIALTLVHEFGFYWCHRLAHHPKLYTYHKVHHEYKQNTVLASQHEHPIDYIVTIATPALLAVTAVAPHSFTLFQWIAWLIMANIDDHVGYEFPWSPVRWFPFAAATDQHEFHRAIALRARTPGSNSDQRATLVEPRSCAVCAADSKNMGCYASKLGIYDKIFKSEEPYVQWRARRQAQRASLKVE